MRTTLFLLPTAMLLLLGACTDTAPADPAPSETAVAAETEADRVDRGEYLVNVMACNDCHTPLKMTDRGPGPDMDRMLSGHPAGLALPPVNPTDVRGYVLLNMTNTAAIGPWGTSYSANLTPDESGLKHWTLEQFTRALREGKYKGLANSRPLLPPMPWQSYRQMTDEDIAAIYAYLRTVKPISNTVPNAELAMGQ